MTERLKSILSLVDERGEVYFLLLLGILTYAWLGREVMTTNEYLIGISGTFGLFILNKAAVKGTR